MTLFFFAPRGEETPWSNASSSEYYSSSHLVLIGWQIVANIRLTGETFVQCGKENCQMCFNADLTTMANLSSHQPEHSFKSSFASFFKLIFFRTCFFIFNKTDHNLIPYCNTFQLFPYILSKLCQFSLKQISAKNKTKLIATWLKNEATLSRLPRYPFETHKALPLKSLPWLNGGEMDMCMHVCTLKTPLLPHSICK